MMLVVVTHIKGHHIERPIVAIGLLFFIQRQVVLLYPTGSKGMQSHREKEAEQEEEERLGTEQHPDGNIEGDLNDPIGDDPSVDRFDFFQAHGADRLEDGKEQKPKGFSQE